MAVLDNDCDHAAILRRAYVRWTYMRVISKRGRDIETVVELGVLCGKR